LAHDSTRREEWTESATDYVLEHGLIGLSLRPLAAHLGTSDRMLLYHFSTKDDLVAAVMRTSNDRSVAEISKLPPSPDVRRAVLALWDASSTPSLERCQRLYVEAAALGLFGREPYASAVRDLNALWTGALTDHLVRSGVRRGVARRLAEVIDAAFMGFQLDLPLDEDARARKRVVADLADAIAAMGV
jgi:AcrR family transcriptional regulator